MKVLIKIAALALLLTTNVAFAQTAKYKCMVQMSSYDGLEAYIVVSLINPKGAYQKTLYMMGDDKKWYNSFKEWFKFNKTKKVDAKTGASVGGGDRAMINLDIEDAWLNKGYKIRFESSVEAKKYFKDDVEIPLTAEGLTGKTEGTGYINYIRFSKVQ
ncbi:DUF2271 domain-containing protein [Pedobacter sp. UBA4863]|uniref:DUF2271 domain-containing protein n=1 Tax=Pedobacter sp. UBA4863 TaxID=1947060 RepID=UPI0025EF9A5B|nr:DUF2271 domain-containing protein [Pedobacter sp. UBA4863]